MRYETLAQRVCERIKIILESVNARLVPIGIPPALALDSYDKGFRCCRDIGWLPAIRGSH